MKRVITILGAVLFVQIALATVLNLRGNAFGDIEPGQPLFKLKPADVDQVVIERSKAHSLKLSKKDGKWRLPDHYGFPANDGKVGGLVETLAGLKPRMPVATTDGAAERFKTGEKKFVRRIRLLRGDKTLATLYLGRSAGARRSYARPDGSHAVYEVNLGTWQASTKPDDWIDTAYLKVSEDDIKSVHLPGIVLTRKQKKWNLEGLKADQATNQDKAASLVQHLTDLTPVAVLGTAAKPEYSQDKPVVTAVVALTSGKEYKYVFSTPSGDPGYYVLKRSDGNYFLKVPDFAVDPLKNAQREKLVQSVTRPPVKVGANTTDQPKAKSAE